MKDQQKKLIIDIMNDDAKDGLYKKQTVVEFLISKLQWTYAEIDAYSHYVREAKEMENRQQDTFAIEFAEWYENDVLAKGDYEMITKDKKELLKIFKETYGKQ